jgi:hypothetical protein
MTSRLPIHVVLVVEFRLQDCRMIARLHVVASCAHVHAQMIGLEIVSEHVLDCKSLDPQPMPGTRRRTRGLAQVPLQ